MHVKNLEHCLAQSRSQLMLVDVVISFKNSFLDSYFSLLVTV